MFQNHCPTTVYFGTRMHSFFILFIIFSLFCLFIWFFFSWFSNTSICIYPVFHKFFSTYFNFITKKQPTQNLKNRVFQILELKIDWRNFKNTMEWMYMNLYGSNTQIWTQTKKKNAPKDQQTQNYKSGLKSNQETKIINKINTTWN